MNALRHGLTGQVLLMPEENLAAFQRHCQIFVDHHRPQTSMEQHLGHQIATLQWRINQAMTFETNMLALGEFENGMKFDVGRAETNTAVMEVSNYRDMQERFALNTLYEQRLTRLYERAVRELKQLQEERRYQVAIAKRAAARDAESRPKEAVTHPANPPQPTPTTQTTSPEFGFVYSRPAELVSTTTPSPEKQQEGRCGEGIFSESPDPPSVRSS